MSSDNESVPVVEDRAGRQGIVVTGSLETAEDESRVRLTLATGGVHPGCRRSIDIRRDLIEEVRRTGAGRVVHVVLKDHAVFTAAEVFGEHGVATCRCGEDAATADRAGGSRYVWPYVVEVRSSVSR